MLSAAERAKIRQYLGYLNIAPASSLSLGFPSTTQTGFLLESAFDKLIPDSIPLARRAVAELDCIIDQLSQARGRLSMSGVDNIKFRDDELEQLESQYAYWTRYLADIFGVPLNPFSKVHQRVNYEVIVVGDC